MLAPPSAVQDNPCAEGLSVPAIAVEPARLTKPDAATAAIWGPAPLSCRPPENLDTYHVVFTGAARPDTDKTDTRGPPRGTAQPDAKLLSVLSVVGKGVPQPLRPPASTQDRLSKGRLPPKSEANGAPYSVSKTRNATDAG